MAPVREEQDRSFYRHVLMENESVLRRCPEGSCSQVDHSACSPTVEPRWTAPHRRAAQLGQPSFSAEAHGRRCPEREAAVTSCLWVLELVIWTRKLVFQVLESVGWSLVQSVVHTFSYLFSGSRLPPWLRTLSNFVGHRRGGHGVHVGLQGCGVCIETTASRCTEWALHIPCEKVSNWESEKTILNHQLQKTVD